MIDFNKKREKNTEEDMNNKNTELFDWVRFVSNSMVQLVKEESLRRSNTATQ